jgi:predicted RNase H-like HicB family nuclease
MRTYTVNLFQAPDEPQFWIGHVPAANAMSQGDTKEQALEMTRKALETVLEDLIETGQPLPKDAPDLETAQAQTRTWFGLPNIELHAARIFVRAVVQTAEVHGVAA